MASSSVTRGLGKRLLVSVGVHPDEVQLVGWLSALFFFTQASHGVGINTALALFFSRFGVEELPLMIVLSGPALKPEGMVVTASGSRDGHSPDLVLDGSADGESFWSSGSEPPGWIEVTFTNPSAVGAVRVVVFQNPPSDTVHVLEVRTNGEWNEVATFAGFTTTGYVLE